MIDDSLKSFEKCSMSHLASLLGYLPAQCAYWDSSITGLHCHNPIFNVVFTKNSSSREANDPLVYILTT